MMPLRSCWISLNKYGMCVQLFRHIFSFCFYFITIVRYNWYTIYYAWIFNTLWHTETHTRVNHYHSKNNKLSPVFHGVFSMLTSSFKWVYNFLPIDIILLVTILSFTFLISFYEIFLFVLWQFHLCMMCTLIIINAIPP